jgi:ATPase subunit of ABC transporter with duplicated ATPase domains
LEKLAAEFRGALIVISHDESFLKNCGVDQNLVIKGASNQSG